MDWTPVALLLLVVGFVSAGLTITIVFWTEIVHADKYAWGWPNPVGIISGIVALIALLSSYIIINKKL